MEALKHGPDFDVLKSTVQAEQTHHQVRTYTPQSFLTPRTPECKFISQTKKRKSSKKYKSARHTGKKKGEEHKTKKNTKSQE